jgi:hypothetical protein
VEIQLINHQVFLVDGEKSYTSDDFKDTQMGDLYISANQLEEKPSRQNTLTKNLIALAGSHNITLPQLRQMIAATIGQQLYEFVPAKPESEQPQLELLPNIKIADISNPTKLDITIACTILGAKYIFDCPPLLLIVGPSATNKTGSSSKFRDDRLVKWVGRATPHAWLPGRPNSDSPSSPGILQRSNHRCILQNDVAAMKGEDNDSFILGLITDSYGPNGITLDDGAGEIVIPTYFTAIFGMTPDMYKDWIAASLKHGQRFLVIRTKNDYKTYHSSFRRPEPTIIQRQKWVSLLLKIVEHYPTFPLPSDEMLATAYKYCSKIMTLCSISKADCMENTTGAHRISDQVVTMAILRAMLYERLPNTEDVEYFLPLCNSIVPFQDKWKQIDIYGENLVENQPFDTKFSNCFGLKIFTYTDKDHYHLTEEWQEFFEKYYEDE